MDNILIGSSLLVCKLCYLYILSLNLGLRKSVSKEYEIQYLYLNESNILLEVRPRFYCANYNCENRQCTLIITFNCKGLKLTWHSLVR
jgi:hypothetical protein